MIGRPNPACLWPTTSTTTVTTISITTPITVTITLSNTMTITTNQPGCQGHYSPDVVQVAGGRLGLKAQVLGGEVQHGISPGEKAQSSNHGLNHPMGPLTHPLIPTYLSVLYTLVPGMAEPGGITPTAVFRASLAAFMARSFRW